MVASVSLAWKNLTHDRRKLALALAGVAFAVLLMFQQRGFNHALFDSTVELVRRLDADLLVFNRARFALTSELRFPKEILERLASEPGVGSVRPLYLENKLATAHRAGLPARPIRVVGLDLTTLPFQDAAGEVNAGLAALQRPDTALLDRLSKDYYGFDLRVARRGEVQSAELSGRQVQIAGLFSLGCDFAHEGNLVMSSENFAKYFRYRAADPLSVVDLGLVKLEAGADRELVLNGLRERLPQSVELMTREEFEQREINFWARSTPIGIIFAIGAGIGFAVGVIICYQILATVIADHYRELATLMAMGYGKPFFFKLVLQQAWWLAILGYLPGLALSWLLFQLNASWTGLLMQLTWERALTILVLTLVMCSLSALLAIRKLLAADPASLF
ncbi:MAG: ABC transporter permease DevC [Planctomycetota bacterium]